MARDAYIVVRAPQVGAAPTSNLHFDSEADARDAARCAISADGADREIWLAQPEGALAQGIRCVGFVGAC